MGERDSDIRPLSDFDIDLKYGRGGEAYVGDICRLLTEGGADGTIEVKRDAVFVWTQRFYVEQECRSRGGLWKPSGIATTNAAYWAFVMGSHPGFLVIETSWLKRAVDMAAQDSRNKISCDHGENPTRGTGVYLNHLLKTRDWQLDKTKR